MASAAAGKRGHNEPPRPIIVKKIIQAAHGGHHGGAWKVAYADFVTAMMAFFMLMWLLSITDQQKRRGLAEYFTPSLMELKKDSAGSDGIMGGRANMDGRASAGGVSSMELPAIGGPQSDLKQKDRAQFAKLKKVLSDQMNQSPELRKLTTHVRFSETVEGLRIDLVDEADFSMFGIATAQLNPAAKKLIDEVSRVIAAVPNEVIVRGHTDARPYAPGQAMNNWTLSTARAEATRAALVSAGLGMNRFARIEGVADREPFIKKDVLDPRNRRMSVVLAWSKA
ncbi:flagellar motor protein MotB [Sphingoaurantiacus capsulatus]|uniref:Flagellar motor protein MotB n=1 Tax=Sphingoaurantiacus capsulatus TaxID=1771310 RepID=A0ABV7XHF1_9SPHN